MVAKKHVWFLLLLIAFDIPVLAQQQKSEKIKFQSINNVGLLEGEKGSAFQLQTINGVKYKSWFGGVGVGLDYYRFRKIPLFAEIRKEFLKSANKVFVYADGGAGFYWKRDNDEKQFPVNDKIRNGFYGEVGAGYKFMLKKKSSLQFGIGYNYEKFSETGSYFLIDTGFGPPGPANNEKVNYNLNKLVLKAGIAF